MITQDITMLRTLLAPTYELHERWEEWGDGKRHGFLLITDDGETVDEFAMAVTTPADIIRLLLKHRFDVGVEVGKIITRTAISKALDL